MTQKNSSSGAGGAETIKGVSYEDRVGAWIQVEILSEGHGYTKFDLGPGNYFESVYRQRKEEPDDILINTSNEGRIYCQATKSVSCVVSNKKLQKTFNQFLVHFFKNRETLEVQKHRLALITRSAKDPRITKDLREALNKVRKLTSDQSLDNLLLSTTEKKALEVVRKMTETLWNEQTDSKPTDDELKGFLSYVTVVKVEVERGDEEHISALNTLANEILASTPRERAENAWSALLEISNEMGKTRSGMDRSQLRGALQECGYELQSTPSYRNDIRRLKEITTSTCKSLKRFSQIELVDGSTIQIKRRYCSATLLSRHF